MNLDKIKLKSVEQAREERASNCLPKGVRAMIVGDKVVFVKRVGGYWMPVKHQLQLELEEKHIIK